MGTLLYTCRDLVRQVGWGGWGVRVLGWLKCEGEMHLRHADHPPVNGFEDLLMALGRCPMCNQMFF